MTNSQLVLMMFDADERGYLNSLSTDIPKSELNRKKVFDVLSFAAGIVNLEDFLAVELVNGLLSKINNMSDSEWDVVKDALPFNVPYDAVGEDSPVDSSGFVLPVDDNGEWAA